MKTLLTILLLTATVAHSQIKIHATLPLKDQTIKWWSYKNLGYIEKDTTTHIRIEIDSCSTRNLTITADSTIVTIKEYWRPIALGKKWDETLAEYTFLHAKLSNGIKEDKYGNVIEYLDNTELYWEKEFHIKVTKSGGIPLTIYCNKSGTLELIGNLVVQVK